ncbi:glycosyltransferase [Aeromonas veronii]|uniref:glycosyltransferase n=1 Tax=Aeromonas veronii TaxID=654 RepID=UPI00191DE487|nr:glycosyltransferase [Aeromonas veronii]MBL0464136.1 glycosyltransferase [Aeromonas veronii]
MKRKISLCFPTYNRADKVIKQISFILNELASLQKIPKIEIVVSDNGSNEASQNKLKDFIGKINVEDFSVVYNTNVNNLGLVGNLKKITSICNSDYIWFIGDDDTLHTGVLSSVFQACDSKKGLLFINHQAINAEGTVVMPQAFDIKQHHDLYDVFTFSGTTMMFITACVYRADLIKDIFQKEDVRLSLPFYTSLKCAEMAGVEFIDEIYIDNYWGETSWSSSSFDVFFKQVPMDLFRSILFSNNKFKTGIVCLRYVFGLLIGATKSLIIKIIKKTTKQ